MPRPPARYVPPKSPPLHQISAALSHGAHYSQDLNDQFAVEKQIAAARADEVTMAAICVDPQILEEHLAVKATVVV